MILASFRPGPVFEKGASAAAMQTTGGQDRETRLSHLIGAIYDSALDPARWESALAAMRDLLDCANAVLYIAEIPGNRYRLERMVGIEPHWAERLDRHGPDIAELHSGIADFLTRPLDEPFVCSRDVAEGRWRSNRYYRNWARPQGIIDVIDTILVRGPTRVASCALGRHDGFGLIGEREIRLARLIAPHLRRAVIISDLIDIKRLEASTLRDTLDVLSVGIVLVTEDARIVHANRAAGRMFDDAVPISSVDGRLHAADAPVTAKLWQAIGVAAREEARLGAAGLGLSLGQSDRTCTTAHVLPLANGNTRPHLLANAEAAVFIASDTALPVSGLEAVADVFGLTPTEARVLECLVQGGTIADSARALGIATTTTKTHLSRILSKTRSRRRPDLLALVHKLVPAVYQPDDPA